jgi:HD-GYP domain-containing protein (c-di-GMP phosphodiesterase class II)
LPYKSIQGGDTLESNNQLVFHKSAFVDVHKGDIQFYNYDEILKQANELAELIKTVEVDEQSIKGTKKLLAEVNKRVNELEQERIRIKKELLSPYLDFEKQIKTITSVVKESDNELRNKVRELEQIERDQKCEVLVNMFNKRITRYPDLLPITNDKFITEKHLNKTVSLNVIEKELVQWLEQRQREVELIIATEGSSIDTYYATVDLVLSMPQANTVETPKKSTQYRQVLIDVDRIVEVNLFLKLNGIDYRIV